MFPEADAVISKWVLSAWWAVRTVDLKTMPVTIVVGYIFQILSPGFLFNISLHVELSKKVELYIILSFFSFPPIDLL